MIVEYKGVRPKFAKSCFIAPTADLIGNIEIGERTSVWYNVVIRGDIDCVVIGSGCSIQDLCALHVDYGIALNIGDNVTIGHSCVIHACSIGSNSMIGMGATILSGAKIGENCIIAAGSVVLENAIIPDNSLVAGIPGKIKRTVSEETANHLTKHAEKYVDLADSYLDEYLGVNGE